MKKIILFMFLCFSIFGFWLTSEKELGLDSSEKQIGLFNFNGDSSWILVDKIKEFVPIYDETGKQIFVNELKSYYVVSINFEEFLGKRTIKNLKSVKIQNDKYETLKDIKLTFSPYYSTLIFEEDDTERFIEFLRKSKTIKLVFYDDNGKLAVQDFNIDGFNDSENKIIPQRK